MNRDLSAVVLECRKKAASPTSDESYTPELDEEEALSSDDDESYSPPLKVASFEFTDQDERPIKKRSGAPTPRVPWTPAEIALLAKECKGLTMPPRIAIARQIQKQCVSLQNRQLSGIKSRAWYYILHGH